MLISLIFCVIYVNNNEIIGVSKNGIVKMGLKIIGSLNMIGLLIEYILGIRESFLIVWYFEILLCIIKSIKLRVLFVLFKIDIWNICRFIRWVIVFLFVICFVFKFVCVIFKVKMIGKMIDELLILNNYRMFFKVIINKNLLRLLVIFVVGVKICIIVFGKIFFVVVKKIRLML